MIQWHPTGTIAFVCSSGGASIQCYDLGLNCLSFQVLSEEPERSILLMIGSHFVLVFKDFKIDYLLKQILELLIRDLLFFMFLLCCAVYRAPVHLQLAEWGSNRTEEEKEGCYDNFMVVFDRLVFFITFITVRQIYLVSVFL